MGCQPSELRELNTLSRFSLSRLSAAKNRFALFNERYRRVTVVLGLTAMYVMGRLKVETVIDITGHRSVQIFLHVAVSNTWPVRKSRGNFRGLQH